MITRNTLKKALIWVVMLALLLPLIPAVARAEETYGFSEMWIKTDNGKKLAVRAEPNKNAEIIGYAAYGHNVMVDWGYAGNDGWSRLIWGSMDGYVQTRYLVSEKPAAYKSPEQKKAEEQKAEQKKLDNELKSEKEITPCYIAVRPSRSTGWVNFRVGPSTLTSKITSYPSGKELIAVGETKNWWRAKDPESGKTGYIYKNLTKKLNKELIISETADGAEKLGKLNVNGEFELTCKLPADYKLQVVEVRGESIIASVLSDDMTKPQMYLSIAYDEIYADVDRMNDMSEEDIAVLKASFEEQDDVTFQDAETGLGTRLLIVREVGDGVDFVDILSVYKGYLVEFNMTPNPKAASQALTDEQIETAIQFLTDVMFEPVQK